MTCATIWAYFQEINYADWNMVVPKGYMLCDSIYIKFLKWKKKLSGERISGSQRLGSEWGGESEVGVTQ